MKILSASRIRAADAYTIENEPIASIDLMERASKAFTAWFTENIPSDHPVRIFCGKGNNGGDGLAVARLLQEKKYRVHVYIVNHSPDASNDFKINLNRLKRYDKIIITEINGPEPVPAFEPTDVIIDAMWGSGLNRPLEGFATEVIAYLNKTRQQNPGIRTIAIDIPSGLFADQPSSGSIIEADHTISFELPKLAFMFPENHVFCGNWHVVSIGLDNDFLESQSSPYSVLQRASVAALIRSRDKFDHKGSYGHAGIASGSYGKMGAAILASRACLRTGAGLLTVHCPGHGNPILQTALPEAMTIPDRNDLCLSSIGSPEKYDALGIGPGIAQDPDTADALAKVLEAVGKPLVIDADALNILSANDTLKEKIPVDSILCPHPGEFKRLAGAAGNDFERLDKQIGFAQKYRCYLILKGAQTTIATPDGNCYFNTTGNPGMATAGSGDVLTGILTGLLAQGYSPLETCQVGVYLHGLAGDIAREKHGMAALIAGDIVENIGLAYRELTES